MLGRANEWSRVEALLDRARRGGGGALLLRGECGTGKSALLRRAVDDAQGMARLEARGFDGEGGLLFGGLADLLARAGNALDGLSARQREALDAALEGVGGDGLAVPAATLAVLRSLARTRPVLVAVDDFHALDSGSQLSLLYAARRRPGGVAFLLAGDLDAAGIPSLELGPLDDEPARELLAEVAPELAAPVAERLLAAAAGNPLALTELPATLTPAQRQGAEALPEQLRPPAALERALLRRVEALAPETREALLLAAASSGSDLGALPAGRLEPAERAGLIELERGHFRFTHSLLAAALYWSAPAPERRAAHRRLAASATGTLERARHLAVATAAPDEAVAALLEAAAAEALRLTGYAGAAAALERAAELSPSPDARTRRLLEAARARRLAGDDDRALALLDRVDAGADEAARTRIEHLRGLVLLRTDPRLAYDLLLDEADRIEHRDAPAAVELLTDAAVAAFHADRWRDARATARRAATLAGDGEGHLFPSLLAELLGDLSAEPVEALAVDWQVLRDGVDALRLPAVVLSGAASVSGVSGQRERAYGLARRMVQRARERGAAGVLPDALYVRSIFDISGDRWEDATAGLAECVALAAAGGQPALTAIAAFHLAIVEGALGREDECRVHAALAAEYALRAGNRHVATSGFPLGLLALTLGRVDEAIEQLERVPADLLPGTTRSGPALVEAYVRAGRLDDAQVTLARYEHSAELGGLPTSPAMVAHCRALLADEATFEAAFADALELVAAEGRPSFDRAGTHLWLGERLRRVGRRADAREPLRAALEDFERIGAEPWAERARAELRASGEHRRPHGGRPSAELTRQERAVAAAVAGGLSNRDVAAALFLSTRTVEFHLRNIYRKLGIHSRAELIRAFAAQSAAESP